MKTVNMREAKANLSRLVAAAARGEIFVIARAGKPLAKVVPTEASYLEVPKRKLKRFGFMEGEISLPDDFDMMMQDEIIAMFEGEQTAK